MDIYENALKWRCATYLTHVRKAVFLSYPVRGVAVGHLHGPVISEHLPVAQGEQGDHPRRIQPRHSCRLVKLSVSWIVVICVVLVFFLGFFPHRFPPS